ncbi:MAG: hypothetical protein RDU30_06580 [Desulfovibrionaceae bacterium]|nr:hypothetical protein [Desulfovibrionaceae bacterium]
MREVLTLDLDKVPVKAGVQYPMVGVYSFGKGLFHREPVDGTICSYNTFNRLKSEHFVMSQLFGWEGALALSSEDFSGLFVSPQFPTFLCEPALNRDYLGYFTRQPVFWHDLGSRTRGMGDRRRTLNPEALFACEIPLPDRKEQDQIVAKLDALSARIDEARECYRQIEQEADAMLHSAFARIIEGAPRMRIADVAPLVRRPVNTTVDGEYPELGVRSFGKGVFHKPTLLGAELTWQKLFRVHEGDIVISNIKAWEGAIAVAGPDDDGRVGSHRYLTLVPVEGQVTAGFLCFYLLTAAGLAGIGQASPGSADRNRTLGQKALEAIEVPIPDYDQQAWFDRLQTEVRQVLVAQQDAETELNTLLSAALDKTFKGEL